MFFGATFILLPRISRREQKNANKIDKCHHKVNRLFTLYESECVCKISYEEEKIPKGIPICRDGESRENGTLKKCSKKFLWIVCGKKIHGL